MNVTNSCQYPMNISNFTLLYVVCVTTIDGIVKYDCGEGQKIFNGNEFHPKSKEEIIDKELIDSFFYHILKKIV